MKRRLVWDLPCGVGTSVQCPTYGEVTLDEAGLWAQRSGHKIAIVCPKCDEKFWSTPPSER